MEVAYLTVLYRSDPYQNFERFHDWVHALRDMDSPPFDFSVHSYVVQKSDDTLYSHPPHYLGNPDELYPTPKNMAEGFLNVPRLRREIEEQNPDIIHVVSARLPLLLAIKSLDINAKVVIGPHGMGGWSPIRRTAIWGRRSLQEKMKQEAKFYIKRLNANIFPDAQYVCLTDYHRDIISTYGIERNQISLLYFGVDPIFRPIDEVKDKITTDLLFIGWFGSPHKGYEIFLRAVAKLDSCSARIVGKGSSKKQDLINRLGINDRVHFEGFLSREELPEIYNSSCLTVIPSTDETGGTTVKFESLACGTPVVATDERGINEFDRSNSVVYFRSRDPDSVAEAIERALDQLSELTESTEAHAEDYSAKQTVEQLTQLYKNILP